MPKYIVNGKTYNIPDDKIEGFERKYPDANVEYSNNGKTYHIPINKREGFLKQYPNAVAGSFDQPTQPTQQESAPITTPQPNEEEYIKGFGAGVKQGTQQLGAGLKYAGGEALDLVSQTAKDNADALAALEQMQAEGKDVAEETKTDAKSVLLPLLGHSGPAIDMVSRLFGKKNPIANANAEVATDRTIRRALKETNGDVEAAKALLAERANEQTTADIWKEEAAQKMNEAKPTKGFGAWVGNMVPQMAGTLAGLGLSAVTKSPVPAQVLGLGQMGALTASTAGASMKEARDAGATNGEVWATGLADAAVELATEAIPFKRYISPLVNQARTKVVKEMADAVLDGKSPARNELQELLAKANEQLGGKLFSNKNVWDYIEDVGAEGLSEFAAEALQTITPMIYAEPENYPTLWEVVNNGVEGLKGGIFMGAVLGGASNAATNKAQRDRRKQQGFVDVAEVKFSDEQNDTGIAEVLSYDPKTNQASVLFDGEIIPIDNASENIINSHRFTFDEFDRGQIDMEQAESYENGRSLETPQEKNDAYNMYEYQAQNMRRIFGLDEDADVDAFIGDDPLGFAMQRRNENPDDGQAVLDYLNAKATHDGVLDTVNDKIDETIAQSNATIDSRVNKSDGLIHPATLKINDRKVYIVSGNVAKFDDGTIDTESSDESVIIKDAETGETDFVDPKLIFQLDDAIDPEQEKITTAEVITNTIADQAEKDIEGVLPFNTGDSYPILDDQGIEHNVTIVSDNGDGTVLLLMDNEQQPTTAQKDMIQQMSEAYNIGRTATVVEAKGIMDQQSKVDESSDQVDEQAEQIPEEAQPAPRIPVDEQGEPIYEMAPIHETWSAILEMNEGNEEEAIDTASIMRDNAQAELDKAMKSPKVKGKTVPEIQAAKAEQKALIKQAQDKLNYWTDVANYRDAQIELMKRAEQRVNIAKAQAASQEKGRYSEENAALGAPIDFRDYVMRSIATGGVRFIWKDSATGTRGLGSHTGLKSNEERNARIWLLNNENGLYPEEAAKQLLTSYAEELGYTPNIDTMDALSEILDVVGSYATPSSMFEAAQLRHADLEAETAAQDEADAQARVLAPIAESLGLTLDEYLAWEEMMYAETLPAFEADYEQITAIFVEAAQQEEILNQNNDERSTENADVQSSVHSEGGLSDGSQAGVGVLQGTQVDNSIADSRGTEAGQGSYAQVVEPSIDDIPASEVSGGAKVDNGYNGRSLTTDEAKAVVNAMQQNAIVVELLDLTPENWIAQFGEDGIIDTPIGNVKMGENQYFKLAQKGREGKLGMIKPTLQSPDIIVEEKSSAKNGQTAERNSSYVFVKAFTNTDGSRNYLFTSVTIRKDGKEVVISNQEKETLRIERLLKEGKLAYISKATLPSEPTNSTQGNQSTILGGAILSESKDTTTEQQKQEIEQEKIQPERISLNGYLSRLGLSSPISDYMDDKLRNPRGLTNNQRKQLERDAANAAEAYQQKRSEAIRDYAKLVSEGAIIPTSNIDTLISQANGHYDNESTKAARRALKKRGYDWTTGGKIADTASLTEEVIPTLIKGAKWDSTGEPTKMRFKRKGDNYDGYITVGKTKYGRTTSEGQEFDILLEDYGTLESAWNAFEQGDVFISPNLASIIKTLLIEKEKNSKDNRPKVNNNQEGIRFRGGELPEEEQIVADAKANGTYLIAPNGNPTNLKPKQWVQVRTKAFKEWFGDWEKAARIEKLRKSKDAKITGNEIEASDDLKQYKKNAQLYGRTLQGEYTNVDTGAIISLQRGRHNGGINEVLQHNYKDVAHLQSVAAIPQIIENGIYIESQPNKDTDTNPNVKEYQMFVCGLKIGGENYTVLAKVAVDSKGNRYYDHNLVSVEKGKLIDIANNEQSAISSGFGTTPDTKSTTNSQRKYKELISLLQTNSSKIVDANGEPKVVYHRTPNEFTIFDTEKIGSATDWGAFGMGFYFSPNSEQYGLYGKNEMALFLNARNPLILDDSNAYDVKEPFFKNGSWNKEASEDFTKWVKGNGYDAVLYKTEFNEEEIVFAPNQVKSATGNIGVFDANNEDIRFRFIGERGATNLDKAEEATIRLDNLAIAREMEDAGKDAKSIKMATGWERGADSKWRYEVGDIELKYSPDRIIYGLRNGEEYRLEQVLTDDSMEQLAAEYPEFMNIKLSYDGNKQDAAGYWSVSDLRIALTPATKPAKLQETIIHELQHAIQDAEGFARGIAPQYFISKDLSAYKGEMEDVVYYGDADVAYELYSIRENAERLVSEGKYKYLRNAIKSIVKTYSTNEWLSLRMYNYLEVDSNTPTKDIASYIANIVTDGSLEQWRELPYDMRNSKAGAMGKYMRVSGEVEARNVETRMGMAEDERRASLAKDTEDVSRKDQIFIEDALGEANAQFRISDYNRQFADLQAEYDALDKNDAEALNEWREKKTSVVRDYLSHIKDRFGMRGELIVFNGANEEQIQQSYQQLIASYEVNGNTNPPTYEAFKEKSLRKNVVGTYRKGGNAITFNATADDTQNRKMQFAETMFHENAHRVSDNLYSDKEFESIWAGAKKSKDSITKMVNELYESRSDVAKGKEYIAKAVGYLANKQKDSFMQFLRDEMPVEELLKKLRSKSEIAKLAVEETLNIIKDEYRVQLSRRGNTRGVGGVGYGSDLRDSGMVLQGDGRAEQGRRTDNAERGLRGRILTAATDLAASLDVKLNIIEDVNDITDRNARQQRAKRGAKAWYDVTTGQVYFVLPNATSVEDAVQTVLHEVVAHKGLRDVVGREHFEEFLGKVFRAADTDTRRKIVALAAQNGWDFNVATEEYLASLAEERFDSRENRAFLQKVRDLFMDMLRAAKIALGFNINDNDLRYMLWRTYQMQRSQGAMSVAEDVVVQHKLGVGNYRYRSVKPSTPSTGEARRLYDDAVRRYTKVDKTKEKAKSLWHHLREAYQDSMLSVQKLMEAVLAETGNTIRNSDDVYKAENQLSSKNKAEIEKWERDFMKPLQLEILDLVKKGASYEDIVKYLLAKHGLERNDIFTIRDAQDITEKWERRRLEGAKRAFDYEKNKVVRSFAGQKAYLTKSLGTGAITQDDYDKQIASLEKQEGRKLVSLENKYNRLVRKIQGDKSDTFERVWNKIRGKDFSGLTELTGEAEHFTEAAQQIVDEFEGKYNTDNLWSKINAATKESLRKSYDSGLMSKETYDKVSTMFKYYVPLRGWDSNVAADQYEYMGNKGMKILPALKTAKGRTSRADDPIATLGSVGESSIIQGNRNLMKLKFLNFAQNNPTSLLTVSEQWYEQNADGTWKPSNPEIPENASADEVDALIKEHEAKMEALGDKATKKRQGLNINLHTTKWEQEEHAVNVKRNGKEYKIFVNGNPIAAQAINGFTNPNANKKDSWEWIEQRATAVKNFMARAFTSMNPAFIFTNLARDLVWAGTSVAIKENAAYARQYTKNISEAMIKAQLPRLVSKWKNGTLDMNVPVEKYFNEFVTNGGETGFTQLNTVDDYKRNMERFIKEAQGGTATRFKKGWRWIWDNVEFLNRSAEDTTRFMVYLTSRQMGRSITESVANAKDITVNFNKKGRGTMGANVLGFAYIFFNATIQSLANFGKLVANNPKKTTAALTTFASSGMIAPMVALSLQAMLSGDDDEPTYWDLPEWVRRNNIVIYVGGSGYVTIPLPHELRPFYGMGELAFSTLMGKEEPETAIRKATEGFASLMPFDYTGNAGNAIVNFTPTIAQPLAQLVVNKDYFGTPIYRKTAFNEMDPEWTKAYKSTNQYLVDATEFVNELTGGDEVKTGIIDLNPAVIEHLFEGYLGGVAKFINRFAKTLSMFWDEDARAWRNVPVLSSFYNEADERTSGSQVNREYFAATDEADEVEHLYSGYKKRAKMGSMEYAEKLNELVNSDVFKRYQTVNSYQKAINKLNAALKEADATDREEVETLIMELKVDMLEELETLNNK